jgi:DNA-binding CsgD family transcriptional regulator
MHELASVERHADDGDRGDRCRPTGRRSGAASDRRRSKLRPAVTYRDLVPAQIPAAGLRLTTSDRPARSARYREILRPRGFEDELRAVIRTRESVWALIALLRTPGAPAFDAGDIALVASLSEQLAEAIRQHLRSPAPSPARLTSDDADSGHDVGLMLFAPDGELISDNEDAHALLDELQPTEQAISFSHPRRLPLSATGALVRARAIAEERDQGAARVLTRSRTGRWLACHASCMRGADGQPGNTALLIEPARPTEIAPLMMAACQLSAREQQITDLIARGCNTANIAHRLHLSGHTVRDYVKAILAKAGVCSRGELVAMLSGMPTK